MTFDFKDNVVLVTGASGGIGREIARQFADAGANLALHYHTQRDAAEQTRAQLKPGAHVLAQADVTSAASIATMVDEVVEQFKRIDILINNAGIYIDHDIQAVSYQTWQDALETTFAVNLFGVANLSYCVARHMMSRRAGSIVNVSSRAAARGEPGAPGYAASKAALNALSGSLAQSLASHGIAVHTVAPGFVDAGMGSDALIGPQGDAIRQQSPLGRVARADEVARAVLFLASRESEFLTGGIVDINGASYSRP